MQRARDGRPRGLRVLAALVLAAMLGGVALTSLGCAADTPPDVPRRLPPPPPPVTDPDPEK